jgi:hypothetical protein
MKKNKILVVALIGILLWVGLVMMGCDLKGSSENGHIHSYGSWQSDSTSHWKECGCGEEYGRGSHSGNPNCTVCDYYTGDSGTRVPSIPTGVTATQLSSKSVLISWNAVSGATSYKVYYGTAGTTNPVLTWTTTSLSYTDTRSNLSAGQKYYYKVSAVNSVGEGSASSVVSVTLSSGGGTNLPNAPTGVTATRNPAGSTTIRVTWNAVSGATSYRVYYSAFGSGSGSLEGSPTTTSFDSTDNTTNISHYFRVTAVNSAGEGSPSSWVSVGPVYPSKQPLLPF